MSVETVIVDALRAWPSLMGVPVYPDRAPDNAVAPYLVYFQVTGRRISDLDGDAGLANLRFQFDIYSELKAEVMTLKDSVREALLEEPLLGPVFISDGSGYEDDTKLYRHRQDFSFWFTDK